MGKQGWGRHVGRQSWLDARCFGTCARHEGISNSDAFSHHPSHTAPPQDFGLVGAASIP